MAIGTNASFVMDAQEVNNINANEEAIIVWMFSGSLLSTKIRYAYLIALNK